MLNSRFYSFSVHSTFAFISFRIVLCFSLGIKNHIWSSYRSCLYANNDASLPRNLVPFCEIHTMRRLRHMLSFMILSTAFCADLWQWLLCSSWEQSLVQIFGMYFDASIGKSLWHRSSVKTLVQTSVHVLGSGFGTDFWCISSPQISVQLLNTFFGKDLRCILWFRS